VPDELAPAETLLQTDPSATMRVGDLARACGMTSTKFIREFKKHHGITPGDYLQDKRVNGARRLIGEGLPLCQAALAMGFSDQAHLQRAFKAHHAMTPGLYSR
jgi:transcriptional regulator GlxA family with amidase domain